MLLTTWTMRQLAMVLVIAAVVGTGKLEKKKRGIWIEWRGRPPLFHSCPTIFRRSLTHLLGPAVPLPSPNHTSHAGYVDKYIFSRKRQGAYFYFLYFPVNKSGISRDQGRVFDKSNEDYHQLLND